MVTNYPSMVTNYRLKTVLPPPFFPSSVLHEAPESIATGSVSGTQSVVMLFSSGSLLRVVLRRRFAIRNAAWVNRALGETPLGNLSDGLLQVMLRRMLVVLDLWSIFLMWTKESQSAAREVL
jgi:hypothetical protein